MNLNQMAFRCPDAEVVDTVRLEGYRLAFCMNGGGNGVATILPEEGSYVDGVLWRISERDERHLDHYEGFPYLYGKEPVVVIDQDGIRHEIMAYTMNSPYKDTPRHALQSLSGRNPERLPAERDRNRPCSGSGPAHSEGTAKKRNPP